jgi:hypothetical protein
VPILPLAIDIANAVATARERRKPLFVRQQANELFQAHPEAEATWSDIADVLWTESAAAGVRAISAPDNAR